MKKPLEQKERILCPICKNGMKCDSVTFHSSQWNRDP